MIQAQSPTVGLQLSEYNVFDGYTLFTPDYNTNVYLINNCGEKVNVWTFNETPGSTCYLLENGTLLRAGRDSLQIRDWNNNVIWTYATSDNGIRQHHDIEPLPNGNILCVVADRYNNAIMITEGRDPSILAANFKLEKIIELQPVGNNNANIVWEWKFIDHFIQDFDSTKLNYGIVEVHPELLDLNFNNGYNNDYVHLNAIDYNADLDQLMITARHLNEIYIIDHSTTTAEAAGHTGGNSNQGGDFLWRWGNPQVYRQGGNVDQKLYGPHDGKWVEPTYLDEGKITVFNNGGDSTGAYSSIHLITPEIISGIYSKESNKFKPLDFEWSWNGSFLGILVNEANKSGTHALPNGNFMICESSLGRISEITKNGEHLWTYVNPTGNVIFNQFSIPVLNYIFRGEKYPPNYAGFSGQSMIPMGIIENQNAVSDTCSVNDSLINTISGNIYYDNLSQTPMDNTDLILKKLSGVSRDSIITDLNGVYAYNNVLNGDYILNMQISKNFGGVNSSDALAIMRHFVGLHILTGLPLKASDVDSSNFINTIDALMCAQRFVGLINAFPVGDWTYDEDTLSLDGGITLAYNPQALCYGDVDASYQPPFGKTLPDMELLNDGIKYVNAEDVIELPLTVCYHHIIGAISLAINYPDNYLEFIGVSFSQKELSDPLYKASNGEIRIGWYDVNPINLLAEDELLVLQFKAKAIDLWPEAGLELILNTGSEIADLNARRISDILIMSKVLIANPSNSTKFVLEANSPNPFSYNTEISFVLPEAATVDLKIYNILGELTKIVKQSEFYKKGRNVISFEKGDLTTGVFIYKLDAVGELSRYSDSRTMLVR